MTHHDCMLSKGQPPPDLVDLTLENIHRLIGLVDRSKEPQHEAAKMELLRRAKDSIHPDHEWALHYVALYGLRP